MSEIGHVALPKEGSHYLPIALGLMAEIGAIPHDAVAGMTVVGEPLETGGVAIARANHRITYPARFMLVAAIKACRCDHATEPGICRHGRNARCASDYQVRLSGPLIDRIDLHVEVPAVTAAELILPPAAEGRRQVGERVEWASALQVGRYAGARAPHIRCNAAADGPPRDATNAVNRVHLAEALPYRALADEMRRAA